MRALTWHGKHDVRVDTVDDPEILNPRDAIIKITSTAICGSDLHLYDGYIPTMQAGDVLGHEFMGEVVETGPKSTLQKGQRVVVPFTIAAVATIAASINIRRATTAIPPTIRILARNSTASRCPVCSATAI
jgi:threonine dehydrogenase-like Zn-dependent dehydrogenase